jgi:Coenzyme PQQ synthesis protein D (PqqD)
MIVRRRGDWLIAKVGEEFVMMSTIKICHIALTGVGARIWELIPTLPDVDAICMELRKEYNIAPDVCRAEVDAFLIELVQHDAVTLDPIPRLY